MNQTLEQIVKLLPEGLSDSGMEDIASLVDNIVKERVDEEVKELSSKVGGYLRMKINEIKEEALRELEQEDATFKAVRVYESLKEIIAEDVESSDIDSAVSYYKGENEKLQEQVDGLNSSMSTLLGENSTLETAVHSLREDVTLLSEETKMPFKSSEQALVLTNENITKDSMPIQAPENIFLTEDVIRLSQPNA